MRKQPIQTSRSKKKYKEHKASCGKCKICHPESQTFALPWMVETMLARKYSKSSTDSTNVSQFQGFINELSVRFRGGLHEFLIEFPVLAECMHKFYKISEIKQTITSVIKTSSIQFSPKLMHFHPPFYRIILRSHSREDRLNMKLKKESHRTPLTKFNFELDLCNNSFIKVKKTKKKVVQQGNKKAGKVQNLNQSLLQIKKLCQKIGIMCKSENEKSVKKFKQQLENEAIRKSPEKDLQEKKFKYNLEDNFSIIQKNPSQGKDKGKRQENNCREVEEIYGISDKKSKKKTVFRQHQSRIHEQSSGRGAYHERRASTQKIQLVPDSPVSQAYYTKQFNYTEMAGPIKPKRKFKLHGSCSKSKGKQNGNNYMQRSKPWKSANKRSLSGGQGFYYCNSSSNVHKKCSGLQYGQGFKKV